MHPDRKTRDGDLVARQWVVLNLILLLLISSTEVQAAPQLDQSFDALQVAEKSKWQQTGAGIGLGIGSEAAQTFTVGITGVLTRIEVQIFKGTNATKKLALEIRRTEEALPAERPADLLLRTEMALHTVPPAHPAFVPVDLGDFCLPVQAGDVLAMVLVSQEEEIGYGWQTAVGNRYGGGGRHARSRQSPAWNANVPGLAEHDLGFKTFVDPAAACRAGGKERPAGG